VDADAGLEDAARAYLAVAEGNADRALRLALADAREALVEASARISFGFVRGRLPVGPAVAVAELEARGSVAAPSRTMTRPVVL
jgi:hypothetical protein